ncbi:MAG TPA: phosphate acyltransferase PlsX [Gemmatimonadales bacterium]|nr:phosphate acyltransferase PlsX [Gemmatimonadales bacterium]
MLRVAVDAMGGDSAPQAEIEGVVQALATLPATFQVQLVGKPDVIEAELAKHPGVDRSRLQVVAASEVIGMAEKPLAAVRKKPDSSIVVGLTLQKQGASDAFISAGNTGAVLAASTVILGLHDGVERASVASLFPTADHSVLVLDAGANVDCSPRELVNFAYLGTVYVRDILGRPSPRVGLLNVGEEEEKGNAVTKEAYQLLKRAPGINFHGNVEGRDILAGHDQRGDIDVLVCDGFAGNVILKFYESVARLIVRLVKRKAPEVLERNDIREVFTFLDYSEYGGAPLLGVKGVAIICHGASSGNAIKNAIRVAVQSVEANLSQHIGAEFAQRQTALPA